MKKTLYIISALVFALSVFGCPGGEDTPGGGGGVVNDYARLVGGKWQPFYTYTVDPSKKDTGYITFSWPDNDYDDPILVVKAIGSQICKKEIYGSTVDINPPNYFESPLVVENGIVYINGRKMMSYRFHQKWPFPNTDEYTLSTNGRNSLNQECSAGTLITYTLYLSDGTAFNDERYSHEWVLRRVAD